MNDNELNAMVAEKVMGQHRVGDCPLGDSSCMGKYEPMVNGRPCLPDYANDIAAAWQVWERVKELGYSWWMTDTSNNMIQVHIRRNPTADTFVDVQSESLPRAICLAALEAMGKVFAVAVEAEGELYFGDMGGGTEWEKEQWSHFAKGLSYRSY